MQETGSVREDARRGGSAPYDTAYGKGYDSPYVTSYDGMYGRAYENGEHRDAGVITAGG